ncbi:MAG TPA: hypothetical protein VNC41_15830 [Acidimicrobiia bacterium]|nr:hypothetical protein [Acidimicrobiia bacterium]
MSDRSAKGLACLLAGAGIAHFVVPKSFDEIVPHALPGPPRFWTQISGVAELGVAAAVAYRPTRRVGALMAAGLFVSVFPGNLQMAWDWRHRKPQEQAAAYARLPLQIPLVVWALRVRSQSS